jgi:hypothetical protein
VALDVVVLLDERPICLRGEPERPPGAGAEHAIGHGAKGEFGAPLEPVFLAWNNVENCMFEDHQGILPRTQLGPVRRCDARSRAFSMTASRRLPDAE